jgi:ABC-type multidrug transport system fused ATPase/permease subunit
MSRFTGDLQIIEQTMWAELDATLQLGGFALVSIVLSVAFQGGLLALPAVLMVGYLCFVMDATGRSSREVKRMANNAVSPIHSALTELRNGAPKIRAMQLEEYFGSRQRALIEEWAGLSFHQKALNSWGLVQASYSALLSLGVALSWRDDPECLQLADEMDGFMPFYKMAADHVRAGYYANQGNTAEAARYRQRLETHAIQLGSAWQVETWSPADTLKTSIDGPGGVRVATTVDRSDKWLAQTPQMFRIGPLMAAIHAASTLQANTVVRDTGRPSRKPRVRSSASREASPAPIISATGT